MSDRIVYLRQDVRGWQWARSWQPGSWWGFYRTAGIARGAAKRSIGRDRDYQFVIIEGESK